MGNRLALLTSIIIFLTRAALGSSITSWVDTAKGIPHVAHYDGQRGKIYHDLCNVQSDGLPVLPYDDKATFSLTYPIAPLSQITVREWLEGGSQVIVFYQRTDWRLIGELFQCEDSGYYQSLKYWDISSASPDHDLIFHGTSIAIATLSDKSGYFAYWKNIYAATRSVRYTTSESIWRDNGWASQDADVAFCLVAEFSPEDELTVLNKKDNISIEEMTLNDGEININTLPVPLEYSNSTNATVGSEYFQYDQTVLDDTAGLDAFESEGVRLGLFFDSKGTRNAIYIGSDNMLHSIKEIDGSWLKGESQARDFWPLSDGPNADFGTTSIPEQDKVWMHYRANGTMAQVYQSALDVWEPAVALPREASISNTVTFNNTDNSTSSDIGGPTGASERNTISTGAQAGIGVGVSLGVIAAAAIGFILVRRRSRQKAHEAARQTAGYQEKGSEALHPQELPSYGEVQMLNSDGIRSELPGSEVLR